MSNPIFMKIILNHKHTSIQIKNVQIVQILCTTMSILSQILQHLSNLSKKLIWFYGLTFRGVWLVHDLLKSRSKDCWNNGSMCTHTPPPILVRGFMHCHCWKSVSWWIQSALLFLYLLFDSTLAVMPITT